MGSNKNRLYIALYPSGVINNEERKYHWGFLIGPKEEREPKTAGMRYHVKNDVFGRWKYEERDVTDVRTTNNLLVRIVIAKITNEERLVNILRGLPVVQDDPNWRCRTWVKSALAAIEKDGKAVGTAVLDWKEIEHKARKYAREKTDAGRFRNVALIQQPKPTWDMLEKKETVP